MATTAMDSTRATAIEGVMVMQRQQKEQQQHNSNGRPVVVADIEIKEEEIACEYVEGALPLIMMPPLLHANLLVNSNKRGQ